MDASPEAQNRKVFYRVKAVKQSGGLTYSQVIALPLQGATGMQLSPNPARESLQLWGQQERGGRLKVALFDVAGRKVQEQEWQAAAGAYSRTLHIRDLQPGMYWVQVTDGEKSQTFKIIKSK